MLFSTAGLTLAVSVLPVWSFAVTLSSTSVAITVNCSLTSPSSLSEKDLDASFVPATVTV